MDKINLAWASTSQQVMVAYNIPSKSIMNFAGNAPKKLLISQTTVTLNEDQAHWNWHQATQLSHAYLHTKYETNQNVNVQM